MTYAIHPTIGRHRMLERGAYIKNNHRETMEQRIRHLIKQG